ncbi:MAG: hypothetical protein COA52_04105 [Hyphomicrobiales bacterium]|nr:MAG: hypothetical protein COA52_04105 [Hyphomicrobiales bacterium]
MVEVKSQKSLLEWLENQPERVSIAIAARVALRVLPLLNERAGLLQNLSINERIAAGFLVVFRAVTLPWVAVKVPTYGIKQYQFTSASYASSSAAYAADTALASADAAFAYVYASAASAASAAYASADAAYADAAYAYADTAYDDAIWQSIAIDRSQFEQATRENKSGKVTELLRLPLWESRVPKVIARNYPALFNALCELNPDWSVWREWYDNRLAGRVLSDAEELCYVQFEEEEWERGSAYINSEIKRRLAGVRSSQKFKDEQSNSNTVLNEEFFAQRPASHSFLLKNNKIIAVPLEATSVDLMRDDIWQEVLRKAKSLRERLGRTQAPGHITDTFDRLIQSLGEKAQDVKPGQLLMHSRSIDAIVAAYSTKSALEEFGEDAHAGLVDFSSSIDDLKATYPEIAKLEAARLAQSLSDADVETVISGTQEIIEIAGKSEIVDQTALDALESAAPEITETNEIAKSSTNELVQIKAIEERNKLVSQQLLSVANFLRATIKVAAQEGALFAKDAAKRSRVGALDGVEDGSKIAVKLALFALVAKLSLPLAVLSIPLWGLKALAQKVEEIVKSNDAHDDKTETDDDDTLSI